MQELNEMKTERDQAMRNVLALEEKLTALTRELERVKQNKPKRDDFSPWEPIGNRAQLNVASTGAALSKQIASTNKQLSAARYDVSSLDRRIAYQEELLGSERALKKAVAIEKDAKKRLDEARFEHSQKAERLDRLNQEAADALDEAKNEESRCKEAYATAISAGDSQDERTAADRLEEASNALSKSRHVYTARQHAFGKLRAELRELEGAIEAAEQALADASQSVVRAQAFSLSAKWDAETDRLMTIGRQLLVARKQAGLPVGELSKLYLPRFAELHASPLGIRDLESCLEAEEPFQLMAS